MPPSIAVGGEDLAPLERDEPAEGEDVDALLEEPDAAVAHQGVHPAGMEGEERLVAPRLVARGVLRAGGRLEFGVLVRRPILVVDAARDAQAAVGLLVAPEPTPRPRA